MKTTNQLWLVLCTIFFIACSKDKAPLIDTESPQIIVTGISLNDTLRNTVSADIKATDNDGIKSIEFFANDSLIASGNQTSLNLSWNTLNVKDGSYTLKTVVIDKSGNKQENIVKTIVQNALIIIDKDLVTSSLYDVEYYVIGEDNEVLNSISFEKGSKLPADKLIIYPKSNYSGKTVGLLKITKDGASYVMKYFPGTTRGQDFRLYTIVNDGSIKRKSSSYTGTVLPILTNAPSSGETLISTDGYGYKYFAGPAATLPYGPDSKILVQIDKGSHGTYNIFDIAKGSTSIQLDLALCTKVSSVKTFKFPVAVEDAIINAYGRPDNEFSDYYYLANNKRFSGTSVNVLYPEELTKNIHGSLSYYIGDTYYTNLYNGTIPQTIDIPDFDVTITNKNPLDFDATFKGDFQYYQIAFGTTFIQIGGDPNFSGINIIAPRTLTHFKIPKIPGYNFDNIKLRSVEMVYQNNPIDLSKLLNSIYVFVQSGTIRYSVTKNYKF